MLVKKHLSGGYITYFSVVYPNGNTAIFGNPDNTTTQHIYPITQMTDAKGYKIDFEYIESGNNYYLSKVSYGGKNKISHYAEIHFNYVDRIDYTTSYYAAKPISNNKLLKSIVSRIKQDGAYNDMFTYSLTHDLKNVHQLKQIDCSTNTSSLNPLCFSYNYYRDQYQNQLRKDYSQFLSNFFSSDSYVKPVYIRSKLVKNKFGDGLITFPGIFSPYTKVGERVINPWIGPTRRYPIYGSGFPEHQKILVAPGLSFYSRMDSIFTESGFQTIQAVDVNGDGVDEIVKVNFGELSGDNTILKIKVYKYDGNSFTSQSFSIPVRGIVDCEGKTTSPISREYFFGDFRGTGKPLLLTVSHNKDFMGESRTSFFALIDLEAGTKISETALFDLGFSDSQFIYPFDLDGDGKMELSFAPDTNAGLDVYELSGNIFKKRTTISMIKRDQLKNDPLFGDLNSDGKLDILVPPVKSYHEIEFVDLPVWAPKICPTCKVTEPITSITETCCKKCERNLLRFYITNLSMAKCRGCSAQLSVFYNNNLPVDQRETLKCPVDDTVITEMFERDYIDNGDLWTAYLSTGKGFDSTSMSFMRTEHGDQFLLMDINSDGNVDLLHERNDVVKLYLNTNGRIEVQATDSILIAKNSKILPVNVCNYFGMSHFVTIEGAEVKCYSYTKDESKANLLTGLRDSYGNIHTNSYSSMISESLSNYIPTATQRIYPYFSLIAPINLLSSTNIYLEDYTNIKNSYYSYYGAVMHRTGLGFCGFERVKMNEYVEGVEVDELRDPEMFGVTIKVNTPYKTITNTFVNNSFSNKKNNIQLVRVSELDKLVNVSVWKDYEYDLFNNPIKEVVNYGSSALQTITSQSFDNIVNSGKYLIGQLKLKSITNIRSGSSWVNKEVYRYNADHLPESRITYTGISGSNKTGETRWTYDSNGNVISEMSAPYDIPDFLGSTYTYDPTGRYMLTSSNALGQTTTYSDYDQFGNPQTITDHKGRQTRYVFDDWGQQTSVTTPDGVVETVSSAWGGKGLYTVSKTVTGKPAGIVHLDALERELRTGTQRFDGEWLYADKLYDRKGRLEKVSLPFKGDTPLLWNTYSFDDFNRPVKFTEASGKVSTSSYDGLSLTETKNGITTTKITDASGKVVSVTDPGGTITLNYKADGQLLSTTSPGNIITTFEYDTYGRQTAINDPSAGRKLFGYDQYGNINVETDANGKQIFYTFDQFGRVTQKDISGEQIVLYGYNNEGLLISETGNNGYLRSFKYNTLSQIESEKEIVGGDKWLQKDYAYSNGQLLSKHYTSNTTLSVVESYRYENGHLVEIFADDASIWTLTGENNQGLAENVQTGQIRRFYEFDAFGYPVKRSAAFSRYTLQDFSYNFNPLTGNLSWRRDNTRGLQEDFGYDELNRLVRFGASTNTYDLKGNILENSDVGQYTYNRTKPFALSSVSPNGSVIPLRDQHVAYNSQMRPVSISEGDYSATFTYNADGDRIQMETSKFNLFYETKHYLGGQYEVINNRHTGPKEILYLGGDAYTASAVYVRTENGEWKINYLCRDYLGSVTHEFDQNGALLAERSYDAWGRLRNPDTHQVYANYELQDQSSFRGYTGHEHLPAFGLINMNARLYDPVLGRFLSPDPYVQDPFASQNYNRYTYAMNNPFMYIDPSGETVIGTIILVGGAIIGAWLGGTASNGGELNPLAWNWNSFATYAGLGVGAIMGYYSAYAFVYPGSFMLVGGINGGWGGISVSLGGTGFLSDWDIKFTTLAGGGGGISNNGASDKTIKKNVDVAIYNAQNAWDYSAYGYASASLITLADDWTGVGLIDDIAIPAAYSVATVGFLYDNQALIEKQAREISRIASKNLSLKEGFTYELLINQSGTYLDVRGNSIYLKEGDVWKYGESINGAKRYTKADYERLNVHMNPISKGNQMEIKIHEKILIYGYFFQHGHLPPGNKIFR